MRAVIQRVTKASVTIEGKINGQIENGLLVLMGIEDADTDEDIEWLSSKIVNLRIFNDEEGVMNISVKDNGRKHSFDQPVYFTCLYKKRESSLLHQSKQARYCDTDL